jgi:hypothetical protein
MKKKLEGRGKKTKPNQHEEYGAKRQIKRGQWSRTLKSHDRRCSHAKADE